MILPATRHFLQSDEWALFQKELGHKIYQKSGSGWEYVAVLEKGYGKIGRLFKRLYVPYGPTADSEESLAKALASLEALAKKLNVDYVRTEPVIVGINNANIKVNGYKITKRTSQPKQTLIIDIVRPMQDILLGMSKTNRYLWSKVDRNGLSFKTSYEPEDLESFLDMMTETAGRTQSRFHENSYYEALAEVLGPKKVIGVAYVYYDKRPLSGVVFADDMVAKTRLYLYAGSFDEARKHSANAPLVVYLLESAKKKGLLRFDFFGVAPADAPKDHRWAGFSKFKRSFGGEELVYAGTWEKPIKPWRYAIMDFIRKFA